MKLRSLTGRFLESLAEAVDSLNVEPTSPFFNPTIAVLSALILTGTAAFSYGFVHSILVLATSVVLILLTRSPIYKWLRILLVVSVWTTVVSVPLPFIMSGEPIAKIPLGLIELKVTTEGLNAMITFILRVVGAAAIFTSFTYIMGWRRIVKGLEGLRMPRELGVLLNLSVIHIPLFLRETVKMLVARESRIMRKISLRKVWGILSTVLGDLLLRGYEHAWSVGKAINARSFTPAGLSWKTLSAGVGVKDLLLLSFSLCILILGALAVV